MGCAASQEEQPRKRKGRKDKKSKGDRGDKGGDKGGAESPTAAPPHTQAGNPLRDPDATTTATRLVGKDKYIGDVGAVVMALENGCLVVSVPSGDEGLAFAFRDNQGTIFVKEFVDDAAIELEKQAAGIDVAWGAFFKSIASDVLKCKARITIAGANVQVAINMASSKDPKSGKPWNVRLNTIGSSARDLHRCFLVPMSTMVQRRRTQTGEALEKELNFARIETDTTIASSRAVILRRQCREVRDRLAGPREKAATIVRNQYPTTLELTRRQQKLARLRGALHGANLDAMYEQGGARYFMHLEHATEHTPVVPTINESLTAAIKSGLAGGAASGPPPDAQTLEARLTSVPTSPNLRKLLDAHPTDRPLVEGIMRAMQRINQWDYDVFAVDAACENRALIYTTYAIIEHLGLVDHFKLDPTTLFNFLTTVHAGYHPNPYHNATHAADVAQINYFIMTQGGLAEKCKLSKEELLAGVLAGAIHDYDHPGFNNNFHTRTNAYLSTLYNDRSVLENHHCACVYEILRLPKYNIFANFSDEQKREVRDTMLEMVLSTDMGNHGKIFQAFRRKLGERPAVEWHANKEDLRLALSISIKMADISNCGRPSKLYLEWAKNIATEFYVQGDAEAKLCLPVSPFMDRSKDKQEFPKGQIAFMNFVVIPMFEAISEFLPNMEFCLKFCTENKEYWQSLDA